MHTKFCIIDQFAVINGSYNWTNKAKSNHESITLIRNNPELIYEFETAFNNIKSRHFKDFSNSLESQQDVVNQLFIRTETLKNVLLLNDEEDIAYQSSKLEKILKDIKDPIVKANVDMILGYTKKLQIASAIEKIQEFLSTRRSLQAFNDPELFAIRLEISSLKLQITALDDEIQEIERIIYRFELMHSKILGKITIEILKLREKRLEKEHQNDPNKTQEYEEAKEDSYKYSDQYEKNKQKHSQELSEAEQKEIKDAYRAASKLCHPDVVAEDQQEDANSIFNDLKEAYDQNDIDKVKSILSGLKKGDFRSRGEKIGEKKKLLEILSDLRKSRNQKETDLKLIKDSDAYEKIINIDNWGEYFDLQKQQLMIVLEEEKNLCQ